jgi:acetyltransferase-like isoleucine patch superfamily enzyme
MKQVIKWVLCRIRLFRLGIKGMPDNLYIGRNCILARDITVGSYVFINVRCNFGPAVQLRDFVMIGPGVRIVGDDHRYDQTGVPIIFSGRPDAVRNTVIERDVWVGADAIIKAGVRIGQGSIVAAGSIVTKDVPENTIVGGVPSRLIRRRFESEVEWSQHIDALDGYDDLMIYQNNSHYTPPVSPVKFIKTMLKRAT